MSKKERENRELRAIHLEFLYDFRFGWLTFSTEDSIQQQQLELQHQQPNAIDNNNIKYENRASINHKFHILHVI